MPIKPLPHLLQERHRDHRRWAAPGGVAAEVS